MRKSNIKVISLRSKRQSARIVVKGTPIARKSFQQDIAELAAEIRSIQPILAKLSLKHLNNVG
jgi:hypothetical protein